MKLRTRNRRSEESLPELVEDIERLARLAYPEATPTMLEVLAKDQFIDSLAEEDIQLRLRQSRPESLRQALETALELESYQLASRQRSRAVREVQLEPDHDNGTSPQHREKATSTTVNTEVLEKLQQCIIDTMQRFTKEVVKAQGPRNSPLRRKQQGFAEPASPQKRYTCWNCGEQGHMRRDCKRQSSGTSGGMGESQQNQGNGQ